MDVISIGIASTGKFVMIGTTTAFQIWTTKGYIVYSFWLMIIDLPACLQVKSWLLWKLIRLQILVLSCLTVDPLWHVLVCDTCFVWYDWCVKYV